MIDIKLHTPIGVKDCLPPEQKRKQQVLRAVSTLFASYGYEEVESPMFEYMEVFSDEKLGSTNPNDMFRFFDRTGKKQTRRGCRAIKSTDNSRIIAHLQRRHSSRNNIGNRTRQAAKRRENSGH